MFKNKNLVIFSGIFVVAVLLAPLVFYLSILFFYRNKIIPQVYVANRKVSGLESQDFERVFEINNLPQNLTVVANNEEFVIPLSEIKFKYNLDQTFTDAFNIFRNENYYSTAAEIVKSYFFSKNLSLSYSYDKDILEQYLSVIATKTSIDPIYPTVKLAENKVEVTKGAIGRELDLTDLRLNVDLSFSTRNFNRIYAKINKIDPTLNSDQERELLDRSQQLLNKTLVFKHESFSKQIGSEEIFKFISPLEGYSDKDIKNFVELIDKEISREPQNSVFSFADGKVKEFLPAKEGVSVQKDKLIELTKLAVKDLESEQTEKIVDIPVTKTLPQITNNEVNSLGINELVGRGDSLFKGSIPGRVHNVGLAASRVNGTLVKPGEVFSFNDTVGDVSVLTGYKQAYIIQDGKTILGDGGGVCQVSTTLFRAVLNAGLPIVERSPHSYRVSYYEQNSGPGLDATVFSPTTDFKFKNDTPANILIQTTFDSKNYTLVIEIYGTKDGRVVQMTKPVVTSSTPPPEDLYIDDPTLPSGTVKQIDYKAWGAKVVFDYSVTRDGEVIQQKKYVSNYKSWQAKFLKGTAPN